MIKILAVLSCLAAFSAHAQIPGDIDPKTKRIQEQVEQLFEEGEQLAAQGELQRAHFNFKRAHSIYKNDLAPLGDKYAQYMVGFMYLTGTGVDEDPVTASAWYRLAAESSFPELLAVRDQVLDSLTDVERMRSDQIFVQLRSKYSDVVLLLDMIEDDIEDITARTGSRISGGSGAVTIVDPRSGRSVSGDEYFRRLQDRIDGHLERMGKFVDLDDFDVDYDHFNIDGLRAIVNDYVHTINDR
ncbi:MAG: hypothetical protein R3358_02145 [Woeseiaceae bacterium]|nr:hypothetical protein [Woeseiaceae bacterium]